MAFATMVLLGCCTPPARADTIPIIDNLPATYTPGKSFTFGLSLPALSAFSSYDLQLVLSTDRPNPALTASAAPGTNYPFPATGRFLTTLDQPPGFNLEILSLADAVAGPGVSVTPGANDQLATITVTPGADFSGPIELSIGGSSSFTYGPNSGTFGFPTDIPPIEEAPPSTAPVPAPSGAILLGIGGLVFGWRRIKGR
jgi:hypothetical protein